MLDAEQVVFIVDDDEAVRDSLRFMLTSLGIPVRLFDSAEAFLAQVEASWRGCLLLDVRMPGKSGLDVQADLLAQGIQLPIIFITGHGDVPMAVETMRKGAVDFVQKPFREQDLLDRIKATLADEHEHHDSLQERLRVERRLDHLTPREMQILKQVVQGHSNKQIAQDIHLSPRTVEIHRANMMQKMEAESVVQLVQQALIADIPTAPID